MAIPVSSEAPKILVDACVSFNHHKGLGPGGLELSLQEGRRQELEVVSSA